ncbi:MAG: NAD(P)H-dependent oxidoreductase subunit E [Anaerolineaceae bacterium]|jgi:NADH:ubiquinone oxidoreductase subunit E|nr:NAD(P)H-dependent oxidoreductase subunit E [Anaerolineaceae bacterium]
MAQTQTPTINQIDPAVKKIIDEILVDNRDKPGATMVILNEVQSKVGYISAPLQSYIADELRIPVSKIHGVVSFYSFFTTTPRGKHTVKFCMGTACYVGGVEQLLDKANQALGIKAGETTPDGLITIEICRCVGACSQAPVIVVDENVQGRVKPNKMPQILRSLQEEEK